MMDSETLKSEYVSIYTRRQAIEDGILIDVSETATEAGFRYPVAVTASVWAEIVSRLIGTTEYGQDVIGRLWDVLYLCSLAARSAKGSRIDFSAILRDGPGPVSKYTRRYEAICGPGDNGEPVITIMKPDED